MDIIKEIAETHPHKVVLSNGKGEYKKIIFARKVLKGRNAYQLEKYTQTQVFHENIEEGKGWQSILRCIFRQSLSR